MKKITQLQFHLPKVNVMKKQLLIKNVLLQLDLIYFILDQNTVIDIPICLTMIILQKNIAVEIIYIDHILDQVNHMTAFPEKWELNYLS